MLRDGESGLEEKRLATGDLHARAVGFTADGKASWVAGVSLWSLGGARVRELPGLDAEVTTARSSADGKRLIAADAEGRVFDYRLE